MHAITTQLIRAWNSVGDRFRAPSGWLIALFCVLVLGARAGAVPAAGALNAANRAFAKVTDYRMNVSVHEVSSDQVEDRVYGVWFKNPARMRVDIDAGPDKGRQIVWQGGAKVKTRRGGLLGHLRATLDLHDRAVSTLRGDSIDTLSIPAMLADFSEIKGNVFQSPGPEIDGARSVAVTLMVEDPSVDNGVTKIVLYLSDATHLPVERQRFAGSLLVKTEHMTDLRINAELTDGDFPS
jgi:outer membrane lipoprotein-sorting protein